MNIGDLPVVPLPGSENWRSIHEWGTALDRQFPGQDAVDFAHACHRGGFGPLHIGDVLLEFTMKQQGDRDGDDWIWSVTLQNGETWVAEGWCDYTGWDCSSGITWRQHGA